MQRQRSASNQTPSTSEEDTQQLPYIWCFFGRAGETTFRVVAAAIERLIGDVGRRVGELRRERSWTQEVFAERARHSVQWVRRIESGNANITLKTFFALARLLGCDPVDLLSAPRQRVARRGRPPKA